MFTPSLSNCDECYSLHAANEAISGDHDCIHEFWPRSIADQEYVDNQLRAIADVCASGRVCQVPLASRKATAHESMINLTNKIPVLESGEFESFNYLWTLGYPLVVNVRRQMTGDWSPRTFDIRHGKAKASVITIKDGSGPIEVRTMTVHDFLDRFCDGDAKDTFKLKVISNALRLADLTTLSLCRIFRPH